MALELKVIKEAVAGALGPVSDIIDNLTTSREEKDAAKIALAKAQGVLESDFHKSQASVIIAEATGKSWLQRNHRPLISVSFAFIVVWNFVFGPIGSWLSGVLCSVWGGVPVVFPVLELPPGLWATITLCIGGYMSLRTYEKNGLSPEGPKMSKRQLKKVLKALRENEEDDE